MEPEGSLPHLQMPATCSYPEPARSIPYPHIPFQLLNKNSVVSWDVNLTGIFHWHNTSRRTIVLGSTLPLTEVSKKVNNSIIGLDNSWEFQEVEAPRFQNNRHIKVVRLSALGTRRLYPRKYSWYSFLLEADSTPGPQCGRKDCVSKKLPWHHRESNPRPSSL